MSATILTCPQCSLINPASAEVCDCGYTFKATSISTLQHADAINKERSKDTSTFTNRERGLLKTLLRLLRFLR